MNAAATPLHTRSGPRTGWVLVRGDGLVTAVDPDFTLLVGAPNQAALVGRPWALHKNYLFAANTCSVSISSVQPNSGSMPSVSIACMRTVML